MSRGGRRPGAGRPKGSGKYGEPTKAVRLPVSVADRILEDLKNWKKNWEKVSQIGSVYPMQQEASQKNLPMYMEAVAAGTPTLVADYVEDSLDLNQHLTKRPDSSFIVRVTGDSMIDAGIHPGDLLIVDRSMEARDGRVVIAVVNGEITVKRLRDKPEGLFLEPENVNYKPIQIYEETEFAVLGVVTNLIHPL